MQNQLHVHFCTLVKFIYRMCLLACRARVTLGDSGLRCFVCVTSFKRQLTPLCLDPVFVHWLRFVVSASVWFTIDPVFMELAVAR